MPLRHSTETGLPLTEGNLAAFNRQQQVQENLLGPIESSTMSYVIPSVSIDKHINTSNRDPIANANLAFES